MVWGCQESTFSDFPSYRLENKSIWVVLRGEFDGDISFFLDLQKTMFLLNCIKIFYVFCSFLFSNFFTKILILFFRAAAEPCTLPPPPPRLQRPRRRRLRRPHARLGGGTAKKIRVFCKFWKTNKLQRTSKNSIQNNKNMDFWCSRKKRISPSNSTRQTTHIDLFSSLYDGKSLKIDSWHPQTIRGIITFVVYLGTHHVKNGSISFPIYFRHRR